MKLQIRDALGIHTLSQVRAQAPHYLRQRVLGGGLENLPSPPWAVES